MNLKLVIDFFNKYSNAPKVKIALFSLMAGISYAMALASINSMMKHVTDGNDSVKIHLLVLFVISGLLHIYFKRFSVNNGTIAAENVVRNVKVAITQKIRKSELLVIENMEKGTLYNRLTESTDVISQAAPPLFLAMEALFSLFAILCYIIYLSFTGFLLIASIAVMMFFSYSRRIRFAMEKLKQSEVQEEALFGHLNDVIGGFKEIRINYKKNRDVFADIESISKETALQKTAASTAIDNSLVVLILTYFIILIGVIFILPVLGISEKDTITSLVASLLFLWGPMVMVFILSRQFTLLRNSIKNINDLDAKLDNPKPELLRHPPAPSDFTEIAFNGVEFCYRNGEGEILFKVGPIDLSFVKGEVVFITGGNGSGKSTLMKLLTGLYYPEPGGYVTLEKQKITSTTYPLYREYFTTIFTDFHIFDKLYGLEDIDEKKVNDLLRKMDINHKTQYHDNRFTNIQLSTGQRKRIAYISTLMEDKPIHVFDEWAADQDPEFRKKFYNLFLDDMRAMGKTVIAVSHDDHYFHTADRIIKMDEGKIVTK